MSGGMNSLRLFCEFYFSAPMLIVYGLLAIAYIANSHGSKSK